MRTDSFVRTAGLAFFLTLLAGNGAQAKTLDITAEPPDVNTSAAPNMLVTIDDSGSMAFDYMGDNPPYGTTKDWGDGPWYCAGVIDPRTSAATDAAYRGMTMNGVFYNPNITYKVPKYKDSTNFPVGNANSAGALTKVWKDGINANRPSSPTGTSTYQDFTGIRTVDRRGRVTDNRWTCPYDGTSPLDDNGGAYYYQLKSSVNIKNSDGTLNLSNLYNTSNWEAVAVPSSQYTNWANWYAYYRTRNQMARSAISLAFDTVSDKLHIAFQNLNAQYSQINVGVDQILPLVDNASSSITAAKTWRTTFFNWLFQIPANNGTPNREATNGAGKFFSYGKNVTDTTNPYWEPIPNLGANGGTELSCRQNFHMLVTDGYWNSKTTYALATPGALGSGDPQVTSNFNLPSGHAYANSGANTKVYWNYNNSTTLDPTLADLGFLYWAKDLRPDLADKVPQYLGDTTTGVTGTAVTTLPDDPWTNDEIYFNPANDPATWQHVVEYMVGLGVPGNLTQDNATLLSLRKGDVKWPQPTQVADSSTATTQQSKIDDTWHAAVNSRGRYFNGGNPNQLITALSSIFRSIARRAGASTALSVSSAIVSSSTEAYGGGYNTSGWSGYVRKYKVDSKGVAILTPSQLYWDAACLLNAPFSCPSAPNQTNKTVTLPNNRKIFTSKGGTGTPFRWASLSSAQQAELNKDPSGGTLLDDPSTWPADTSGSVRVDYVRGTRTNESLTATPNLRQRVSVLGAVINSQPIYVSSPGGLADDFPVGSPEQLGYVAGKSYEKFVKANASRTPVLYVGANDGMLHAFDAQDGSERWAFIPSLVITNDQLTKFTSPLAGLVPTVDSTPVVQDIFANGEWHTILVGTLRLGGRGVFALDITDPVAASEAAAAGKFLWEFTSDSTGGANLGYTFFSANVIRSNSPTHPWLTVVSSGYFPKNWPGSTSTAATTDRTSVFVLDAWSGQFLAEVRTPVGTTSYGLSTPAAYDTNSDRTVDALMAGDMAGNLWRIDTMSRPGQTNDHAEPNTWTAVNFFRAYETGGAAVGDVPISVMPVAFYDAVTKQPIWVFGTGKYLGDEDRIASNAKTQYIFGLRDYGETSTNYPIVPSKLFAKVMKDKTVNSVVAREVFTSAVPSTNLGWKLPMDQEPGERVVVTVTPLYASNVALVTSLIPNGTDPCDPKRTGFAFGLDAASGSGTEALSKSIEKNVLGGTKPDTSNFWVGVQINNPSISGNTSAQVYKGGGGIQLTGMVDGSGNPIVIPNTYWHRGAWRELLDLH